LSKGDCFQILFDIIVVEHLITLIRATIADSSNEKMLQIITKLIYDPNFKGCIELSEKSLYYDIAATQGRIAKRLVRNILPVEMNSIYFPPNHDFFEVFDEKIQQLFTAGIVNHFVDEYKKYENLKRYKHLYPDGPRVLSLMDLEAGFVIWLASISFAMVVFVIEWMIRIRRWFVFVHVLKQTVLKK
jgi:hypothetical protein